MQQNSKFLHTQMHEISISPHRHHFAYLQKWKKLGSQLIDFHNSFQSQDRNNIPTNRELLGNKTHQFGRHMLQLVDQIDEKLVHIPLLRQVERRHWFSHHVRFAEIFRVEFTANWSLESGLKNYVKELFSKKQKHSKCYEFELFFSFKMWTV